MRPVYYSRRILMKRLLLVLAILTFCLPVFAAEDDGPTELTGSAAFVNYEAGDDVVAVDAALEIGFGPRIGLGPVLQFLNIDPQEGDSVTLWSIGPVFTLNFADDHNGVYIGAKALWPQGEDEVHGYVLSPLLGFKYGENKAFVKVEASHPFHINSGDDDDSLDLERTEVAAGFGWRF
jgi:hypothetical protein